MKNSDGEMEGLGSEPLTERDRSSVTLQRQTPSRCSVNRSQGRQTRRQDWDLVLLLIRGNPEPILLLWASSSSLQSGPSPHHRTLSQAATRTHNSAGERLSKLLESQFDKCTPKTMPIFNAMPVNSASSSCKYILLDTGTTRFCLVLQRE